MGRPPLRAPIPYGQGSHIRTSSLPKQQYMQAQKGGGQGQGGKARTWSPQGPRKPKEEIYPYRNPALVQDKKLEYRRQRKS